MYFIFGAQKFFNHTSWKQFHTATTGIQFYRNKTIQITCV